MFVIKCRTNKKEKLSTTHRGGFETAYKSMIGLKYSHRKFTRMTRSDYDAKYVWSVSEVSK